MSSEDTLKCLGKSENLLGQFLSPGVFIGCILRRNIRDKKLPANWKQGDPFSILPTVFPHISGIFIPFPRTLFLLTLTKIEKALEYVF
jgi:hypothetical protein